MKIGNGILGTNIYPKVQYNSWACYHFFVGAGPYPTLTLVAFDSPTKSVEMPTTFRTAMARCLPPFPIRSHVQVCASVFELELVLLQLLGGVGYLFYHIQSTFRSESCTQFFAKPVYLRNSPVKKKGFIAACVAILMFVCFVWVMFVHRDRTKNHVRAF